MEKTQCTDPQTVKITHRPHLSFIHHQTHKRRCTVLLMMALQCKYHKDKAKWPEKEVETMLHTICCYTRMQKDNLWQTYISDATDRMSRAWSLTVKNVKQSLGQPQQVAETVETKVDQMPCQLHDLSTNGIIITYSQTLQASCINWIQYP